MPRKAKSSRKPRTKASGNSKRSKSTKTKARKKKTRTARRSTPKAPPAVQLRPPTGRAVGPFRTEKDSLGSVKVPAGAYYGAQTQRAVENFPVSGRRPHRELVLAYVAVKKACAITNQSFDKLDERRSQAICQACDEVLGQGALLDQWVVDPYQAGAGTSMNMNTNEVLANRALELMEKPRGRYDILSPNDHVNMSQSTNDTFPTAMHAAILLSWQALRKALDQLARDFAAKGRIFDTVLKSGRTHLQDAVPIRLGQEFGAYGSALASARARLDGAAEGLEEVALGGSAVGTGLNTHERFASTAVGHLGRVINLPLRAASDLRERMQSMLPVAAISSGLRNLALELIRIANDLRLLSSGPRTGLAEIQIPAVQPGSSIMPGKINPSLAECLNMICFQVIGNDTAVAMAVQAGQLELNVMMPGMAVAVLDSTSYLANFLPVFGERCVGGITVDDSRCRVHFENSLGLATVLNQRIGYLKAAEVAKQALEEGSSIVDVIRRDKLMTPTELKSLLSRKRLTEPCNTVAETPLKKKEAN